MEICCNFLNQRCFQDDLFHDLKARRNYKIFHVLKKHRNLRSFRIKGKSLLHLATQADNVIVVKYLIINKGFNPNVRDANGETSLMLICKKITSNTAPIVKVLLEGNACMQMTDYSGHSALDTFMDTCKSEWTSLSSLGEVLRVFYKKLLSKSDRTEVAKIFQGIGCPLPLVITLNDAEFTRCMLENGSELSQRAHGETALHVAVELSDFDNAKLLLESGADIQERNRFEQTPLCKKPLAYKEETDDTIRVLELLLDHGASLEVSYAKFQGYEFLLQEFLTFGSKRTIATILPYIDIFSKHNMLGCTPLHYLAKNTNPGVEETLKYPLSKNFQINELDYRSAVCTAVTSHALNIAKVLIEYGAKVDVVDLVQHTPIISTLLRCVPCAYRPPPHEYYSSVLEMIVGYKVEPGGIPASQSRDLYYINKKSVDWRLLELIITYLVIAESSGKTSNWAVPRLMNTGEFQLHYQNCRQLLDEIKSIVVDGSVTIGKLLTETQEKIIGYVHNKDLLQAFYEVMRTRIPRRSQFHYILKKRIQAASKTAIVRNRAADAIGELTTLPTDSHRHILEQIVRYLSPQDLDSLILAAEEKMKL